MDRQDTIIFLSFLSTVLGTLLVVSRALLKDARQRLTQAEVRIAVLEGQKGIAAEPDRLALVEGDLDALHAQLDRLAEGQEFLTRVLTQQHGVVPPPARLPSHITPH